MNEYLFSGFLDIKFIYNVGISFTNECQNRTMLSVEEMFGRKTLYRKVSDDLTDVTAITQCLKFSMSDEEIKILNHNLKQAVNIPNVLLNIIVEYLL